MKKEELAELLDGSKYPLRISSAYKDKAKSYGLVVVYGASDDLIEFDGAWRGECGCYGGGTITVGRQGVIPPWEDVMEDVEAAKDWFDRQDRAIKITAKWNDDSDGPAWSYLADIPKSTFTIVEDGEPYCVGFVFDVNEVWM